MKKIILDIILIALLLLACTLSFNCKDKVELPYQPVASYNRVYMPEAVNGPVSETLLITDSIQTATYGANFGGQDYPTSDIAINFVVNKALADSFNMANKTSYPMLPDGSYTLSAMSSVIPKGKLSTPPLSISFKTNGPGAMNALITYILPVSILNTSVKVNENLRTTYYLIKAQPNFNDYQNYDRTNWQVIAFSSQEANGEGPNNGRAIFALDGNTATYWHTQWQGASPGPPHYLTIDMGQVETIHGLSFVGRQSDGAGKPNAVDVMVSTDNVNWTDAGSFNLQNNQDLQKVFLPNGFQQARYFQVIINSAYNASYTQIAELNAF
jgi:hypothetical protein